MLSAVWMSCGECRRGPIRPPTASKRPQAITNARPDYSDEAGRWRAERLDLRPGRKVVDSAAGTGKLTRALVATGAKVVAVEPVAGTRERLAAGKHLYGLVVPGYAAGRNRRSHLGARRRQNDSQQPEQRHRKQQQREQRHRRVIGERSSAVGASVVIEGHDGPPATDNARAMAANVLHHRANSGLPDPPLAREKAFP